MNFLAKVAVMALLEGFRCGRKSKSEFRQKRFYRFRDNSEQQFNKTDRTVRHFNRVSQKNIRMEQDLIDC